MKKTMRLWDIVFINVTAIIGLRWLPIAAGYGAAAPLLWAAAAILFFLPLGLVSAELATGWPNEGGLYVWVREAFGEKPAFMISWFYWVNSFFYWPSLFTFIVITITFIFDPALATNKYFICSMVLGGLWIVTLANLRSMGTIKFFSKLGGSMGIILPGLIIIVLGFMSLWFWKRPSPTSYALANWLPSLDSKSNIAMLSTLMFSMAGIELTPILAGETHEPQKTFPRAIIISAIFIVSIYVIGTMAMTFLLEPSKIGAASGIMDALHLISKEIGLPFILPIVGMLIVLGGIGGACVWLVVPIKMFFESCKKGVLPKFFIQLNKNDMPSHAILIQAVIVSVVVIGTALMPSVNIFYETLVLMATITYFIPYLAMFASFIKLRRTHPQQPRPYHVPGGKSVAWIVTVFGMCSVSLAILLPFVIPPADVLKANHGMAYRIELMTGAVLFGMIGYVIYFLYERRKQQKQL